MSDAPTVSIVIVSRHRPKSLELCLLGISQLTHRPFEVVIVADGDTCKLLKDMPRAAGARIVAFDEPNVSAARNAGISEASGDVVAFIDDDAVPEPTWLSHLVAPFARADVMAAGGYVRGRNGISFQSRARMVDHFGMVQPLTLDDDKPVVLTPTPDKAIKTEGTNMALRRDCLLRMGGFDPAFHFYLDETDLNIRLAEAGMHTAIVPLAQVHHGFAASARRRADRMPTDLSQIGASWAVFLRKHCPVSMRDTVWGWVVDGERRRLLRQMVQGACEPRDVRVLMHGLEDGYREGLTRMKSDLVQLADDARPFQEFTGHKPPEPALISGRAWQRSRLRRAARDAVSEGKSATLIRLSPTALYHHVRFTSGGYWEQTGGIFGKSERAQPIFRLTSFRQRVQKEAERVASVRGSLL